MGHHRKGGFHGFIPLRFLIAGAWDNRYKFALESLVQLPEGSRMALQVPDWLGRALRPVPTNVEEHEDSDTDPDHRRRVRIPLNPRSSQRIGEVELDAKTTAASHLLVQIPEKHQGQHFTVGIRQLYGGREVGRVTWRLVPGL
jgi:hypothetical protein